MSTTLSAPTSAPTSTSRGTSLIASVGELLAGWSPTPAYPDEAGVRETIVRLARAHPDTAHKRDCPAGHVTASTVLVEPTTRQVLLTLHPKFDRWMQLGGHLEDVDPTVWHGALRECEEESGLTGLSLGPLLGVGAFENVRCRANRPATHYDIRFLALTERTDVIRSDESIDLAWWPLENLPHPHDEDLARLAQQALTALA